MQTDHQMIHRFMHAHCSACYKLSSLEGVEVRPRSRLGQLLVET